MNDGDETPLVKARVTPLELLQYIYYTWSIIDKIRQALPWFRRNIRRLSKVKSIVEKIRPFTAILTFAAMVIGLQSISPPGISISHAITSYATHSTSTWGPGGPPPPLQAANPYLSLAVVGSFSVMIFLSFRPRSRFRH
ncbi:MAG TPA: hypothetical protein VGS11_04565 [Candidatus Bathyarchaeia archaeon]|nr:hypothetical protein [Candidatus Bathyarchaeia archaeon]